MLSKISIQRFKNLNSLDLPLSNVNVVVGSNNSGKSSILQAIQFAVSIAQTAGNQPNTNWKRSGELSTSLSHQQLIYAPLRDVSALAPKGYLYERKEDAITITFHEKVNNEIAKIIVRKGRNRNLAINIEGKELGEKLQSIENPFSIYVPGLAGIPDVEKYETPGIVRKAVARGDANKVFRNVLNLLKHYEEQWQKFLENFNDIFPTVSIDVQFDPDLDDFINCLIKEEDSWLPIDLAGTGILQAIQILSYVNLYMPKILILDEPDSHLHPNNQRKLAKLLSNISEERDIQIVLTTHSRHLMDELIEVAQINWITNGELIQEKFDVVQVLIDIGALDKGELLFSGSIQCVVLTEDQNTDAIEIILNSSGFILDEVDIWSYKGCTNVEIAITLADFIRTHSPNTKILIHRDRDYLNDEEVQNYKDSIKKANMKCFVTEYTDIESNFIDAKHINALYPSVSVNEAQELIDEVTTETEKKSIEKFINNRTSIEQRKSRKEGNRTINHGKLSFKCSEEYKKNIIRYRHGKTVFKALKQKLQTRVRSNINLVNESSFLKIPELEKIASEIWSK
jgi:AAA15 family ATPase/GTPase